MKEDQFSSYFQLMYYGKIPAHGDFVANFSSSRLSVWWDSWFQKGLISKTESFFSGLSADIKGRSPVWNFAIPDMGNGFTAIGCIILSRDKVGREYPFVCFYSDLTRNYNRLALQVFNKNSSDIGRLLMDIVQFQFSIEMVEKTAISFSERFSKTYLSQQNKVTDSDGILDILNNTHDVKENESTGENEWPFLEDFFDPTGIKSFWWGNAVNGVKKNYTHNGVLNSNLFSYLFRRNS